MSDQQFHIQTAFIPINISYNDKIHTIMVNSNDLISQFANTIAEKLNINFSVYDVYYHLKQVHLNSNMKINDIIGNNTSPIFTIKKKGKIKLLTVVIDSYPSLMDMSFQIQLFCNAQNERINYDLECKNNQCEISFEDKNKGFLFIQFMQKLKASNRLYYNITITTIYPQDFKYEPRIKKTRNFPSKNSKSIVVIDQHKTISASGKKRNRSYEYLINNPNKKEVDNFYLQQKFIRNSSPYISEDEKKKIEAKESKKYWVANKGFITSVGRYSSPYKDITNYVNATPSDPPVNYKFRDINKDKWISRKGFT